MPLPKAYLIHGMQAHPCAVLQSYTSISGSAPRLFLLQDFTFGVHKGFEFFQFVPSQYPTLLSRLTMTKVIKVAAVQAAPVSFDLERSLEKIEKFTVEAAQAGADLIAFP